MIPHDAVPIGASRVAELYGISPETLRAHGYTRAEGFPAPLNPGGNPLIWDERQVIAHRDGKPVPEVITDDALLDEQARHPWDRLSDVEAAAAFGVTPATWRRRAVDERTGATPVEVCGLRYWLRGTITRRNPAPPGVGGRSVGDVDLKPRKPRGTAKNPEN